MPHARQVASRCLQGAVAVVIASNTAIIALAQAIEDPVQPPAVDERPVTRQEFEQMRRDYERRLREMEDLQGQRLEGAAEGRRTVTQVETEAAVEAPAIEQAEGAPAPLQPDPFEFHGYLRSGFGVNGRGGDMETFQAPGAFSKYRLGNEAETYGELLLKHNFPRAEGDPAQFDVQVRVAFVTGNDATFDADDTLVIREAFAQAKDVIPALPGASFWAGQRFYQRHDIYITDFYLLDMSGYGGGVENIKLGDFGNLHIAYIGFSDDAVVTDDLGRVAKNNVDIRVSDIDLLGGKATLWFNYAYVKGGRIGAGNPGGPVVYDSAHGPAGGVIHELVTGLNGFNKFSIQYGTSAAASLSAGGFVPPTGNTDDANTLRITNQYTFQPVEQFSMQAIAVYQLRDTGDTTGGREEWISGGARPIFHFTRHLALAFEGGVDYVDSESGGYNGALYKFTIAPMITFDRTFFGRPQLRVYYTYAFWDDELVGSIGGQPYSGQDHGSSAGVQLEAWW